MTFNSSKIFEAFILVTAADCKRVYSQQKEMSSYSCIDLWQPVLTRE